LLALDPADFQTKWRRENPTGSHVSLNEGDFDISIDGVFTDVLVFSGFREHSLYELNSATGQEVRRQTISAGEAVIQVTPDNYYTITTGQTGDDKSTIYSIERQTGRVKWSFALALSGAARITEGEGIVYLEGDEVWSDKAQNNVDTLYALDSDTGSVKWTYNCMNCRRNSGWAVASEGRVYVVGDDGLLALDGKSGKELWRDSTAVGAPAVGSRTVYIPDAKGLVARDSGTGQEKWAYGGEGVGAEPLLVGNAVYCLSVADVSFALGVTKKFRIQAVDANNGKALWNYVANGELSTSNELTGGEGAIFFQHEGQTFVFR
jgi:outer membrane protein assembly factor BamB